MHIEYEVRILNINKEEIKEKLDSLGATFKWERIQQRYTYDFNPILPKKWIRLRTNGNETTLTIKDVTSFNIDGIRLSSQGFSRKFKMPLLFK